MGISVIPNKLKEELEDVKKVYDYGKTICTHPNSFDRLQAEIIKVCNVNKELELQIKEMKTRIKEIVFLNDFVNSSPHQNLERKVRALCDFYKEIKEK